MTPLKRKMQVFVSSTFTDLVAERQAAVSAILKSGHIPAGMELFTAGDKSQLETIKRWIDQSDVYMLVLGGRYGSIEPTSNISYTELEYDYAAQQGKPLFAVVIKEAALEEKTKISGTSVIEKENPKELKLFREKVLSNISSFFSDEKDIRLCVYESLNELGENPDIIGWVPASALQESAEVKNELDRLREENEKLKKQILDAQKVTQPRRGGRNSEFNTEEMAKTLGSIEIKIPEKLVGRKDVTNDLLSLTYIYRDNLTNGVTNSGFNSEHETFLYHNVAPKLIAHNLAANEKVAGVQYRRTYLTPLGLSVLAEIDKQRGKLIAENPR